MNIGRAALCDSFVAVVNRCSGNNLNVINPNFKVFIAPMSHAIPGVDGIEIKSNR